jgi:RNA polymerase sigma factor (sigma-70 family)
MLQTPPEPDNSVHDQEFARLLEVEGLEHDAFAVYLHEIAKIPPLSKEREYELAKIIREEIDGKDPGNETKLQKLKKKQLKLRRDLNKKDLEPGVAEGIETELRGLAVQIKIQFPRYEAAKKELVQALLRLVVVIAKEHHRRLSLSDAVEEGNIGLMEAVDKFDPTIGSELAKYARWWIRQRIDRASRNIGKNIRLPVHVGQNISLIGRVERKLKFFFKRDPTYAEIAVFLNDRKEMRQKARAFLKEQYPTQKKFSRKLIELTFQELEKAHRSSLIQMEMSTLGWKDGDPIPSETAVWIQDIQNRAVHDQSDLETTAAGRAQTAYKSWNAARVLFLKEEVALLDAGFIHDKINDDGDEKTQLLSFNQPFSSHTLYDPTVFLQLSQQRNKIAKLISKGDLNQAEEKVLRRRFGLLYDHRYDHDESLEHIGNHWYGGKKDTLSKQRIRQIEVSARQKLREAVAIFPILGRALQENHY